MLKSICTRCGKLLPYGKQCECRKQEKRERNRIYDRTERNKETNVIYHSKEWLIVRDIAKARDNGLCLVCLSNNHLTPCDMVHHIEEASERPELAYELDNLICLCNRCHRKVHKSYATDKEAEQHRLRGMVGGSKLF